MSFSDSVRSNYFLRKWVSPAEMTSEAKAVPEPASVPEEGWRRCALRGADMGAIVGSAATLPVDLVVGTLRGSARKETEAEYARVGRDAILTWPSMPLKQRFLLRLEDGLFGALNRPLRQTGRWLGAGAGALVGVAVGMAEWSLKTLGCAALWASRAWHATAKRPAQPVAFPGVGTILGLRGGAGARVGEKTGECSVAMCVSLACLGASLASAGVKGTCMAAGAVAGGLVGLGFDARDAWRQAGAPAAAVAPAPAPISAGTPATEPVPAAAAAPFAEPVPAPRPASVLKVAPFSDSTSELESEAPSLRVLTPRPMSVQA